MSGMLCSECMSQVLDEGVCFVCECGCSFAVALVGYLDVCDGFRGVVRYRLVETNPPAEDGYAA